MTRAFCAGFVLLFAVSDVPVEPKGAEEAGGLVMTTEEDEALGHLGLTRDYRSVDEFLQDLHERIDGILNLKRPSEDLRGLRMIRAHVWYTLEDPTSSLLAAGVALVVMIFIFLSVGFFMADSVPAVSIDFSTGESRTCCAAASRPWIRPEFCARPTWRPQARATPRGRSTSRTLNTSPWRSLPWNTWPACSPAQRCYPSCCRATAS